MVTWREIKQLVDELFSYHHRPVTYEHEFRHFRELRELPDDEVNELWEEADELGMVNVGTDVAADGRVVIALWRPEDLGEPPWDEIELALREESGGKGGGTATASALRNP